MKTIRIALLVIIVTLSVQPIFAADWPTYRADAARSGYSSENLPEKLTVHWTLHPHNSPQPAWQAPDTRMPFDYAYHAVVSDGLLFYGSSADCAIHALNTSTGDERWLFITDSPVRFAPAIWKQRVYAVSDDGVLYCLSAPDGRLLWSKRGGPDERMILGNDRMVSKWPAMGQIL